MRAAGWAYASRTTFLTAASFSGVATARRHREHAHRAPPVTGIGMDRSDVLEARAAARTRTGWPPTSCSCLAPTASGPETCTRRPATPRSRRARRSSRRSRRRYAWCCAIRMPRRSFSWSARRDWITFEGYRTGVREATPFSMNSTISALRCRRPVSHASAKASPSSARLASISASTRARSRAQPRLSSARMYAGEHAKTRADEPALIMANSGEVVTYREFEAAANRVGAPLPRAQGCSVETTSRSSSRTTLACSSVRAGPSASGLYYTCINSYLAPDEVAYIVNDCESRVVVTSAAKREIAMQLPALCPERRALADGRRRQRRRAVREPRATPWPSTRPNRSTTSSSARRCSTRRARPGSRRGSCVRCLTCRPRRAAGRDGSSCRPCSGSARA